MNKIRIIITGINVQLLTLILLSLLAFPQSGYSQDTTNPPTNINSTDTISKGLQIDTVVQQNVQSVQSVIDTVKSVDSLMAEKTPENAMTNTKLFIYILLSVLGLTLFFFIFVITLFKTFHKKKSTRQSLLLSWNLFFIVTIIWLFIVWGLVAGFWTVASFMIVMIFLFIISLIMTIIALKSK
ncbi:MAG: hypothetical protein IPL67_19185 [Ignavibacteria bacterium]|nr:hypothetical protein [Ignavibacteria bacterium]